MNTITPLPVEELKALLDDIRDARIAVLGDYCLDVYFFIDMSASENSIETHLETWPVKSWKYALGGAGNVVTNISSMGCQNLYAFGVVGRDLWGSEILNLLQQIKVNISGMITGSADWSSFAYIKPYNQGTELNRLDFGNYNRLGDETAENLMNRFESLLQEFDCVVVNQQVRQGIHSPVLRQRLVTIMEKMPDKIFVVDSRHYTESYADSYLKINEREAVQYFGNPDGTDEAISKSELQIILDRHYARFNKPLFITRGERGCLVRDADGCHEIPGIQIRKEIDTVGAGDSMLAGIAAALARGKSPVTATMLGSLAAAVAIQKIQQTGSATPEEILEIGRNPEYIYRPD